MPQETGRPDEFRWADPNQAAGQTRELVIATINQTSALLRIADALESIQLKYCADQEL